MPKDARVDAYIDAAPEFARPILKEIRRRMHASIPGIEETIKWSAPTFAYKGKLVAGMAAFKAHCRFGFWHMQLRRGDTSAEGRNGWGPIESLANIGSKKSFAAVAKKAKRLVDDGVKSPAPPKKARAEIVVPEDLAKALKKNAKAREAFEAFSYSHRKEYCDWIAEAKRPQTRAQRLATTLEWLAQGKPRHWKYINRQETTNDPSASPAERSGGRAASSRPSR